MTTQLDLFATAPKWWVFRQNNSGGSFDHDAKSGIGIAVAIEAYTLAGAVDRAENIGLYFDGCSSGIDCSCCGDRWHEPWDEEGYTFPHASYGQPVRPCEEGETPTLDWDLPVYVHPIEGKFYPAFCPDDKDFRKQDGSKNR